jgi:hypothetical protein
MQEISSWTKYIIIAIVVLAVAGGGIFYFYQKKSPVITPGESVHSTVTPTPAVELTTWTDPAGFSFQYPKDLSVNKHDEDPDNYAHVELTSKNYPGNIIVWASDVSSAWPPKVGTSIDTTLGGIAAKKIFISTPSAKFIVGAVSEGLVFKIEGTYTDKQYWQPIEDGIVKSFTFVVETSAPAAGAADEEEVVQ